LFLRIWCWKDT